MNHQTPFDQFFVSLSFRRPIYYLATEDLMSNGWISRLIRYLVAPIAIKKQTADVGAIVNCIKVAREGGTIALAPEGNRTFSGCTEYINPSIVSLVKKLNLPLMLYRIEGGYGAHPRWSDVVRNGPMRAGVARVVEPEEFQALSDEALLHLIQDELYVNEAKIDVSYSSPHLAEYLERCIYICPKCDFSTFESAGDCLTCSACQTRARYLPSKEFENHRDNFGFRFVKEWYDFQVDHLNSLSKEELEKQVHYEESVMISRVVASSHKERLTKETPIRLTFDKIEFPQLDLSFSFDELKAVTVLSRNKLNLYHQKDIYQIKGVKPNFNALKYVHLFHRYKNLAGGTPDAKFLGL